MDGNNKHLGTITDGDMKNLSNIKTSQEKFQRFIIKIVYFKDTTSQKIRKFMKEKNYP